MWLITRESFVSVVRNARYPHLLHVRARRATDIKALWPDAAIVETPDADYGFRADVAEDDVVSAMEKAIRAIRYSTDFKGGVRERNRHDAYMKVWTALLGLRK